MATVLSVSDLPGSELASRFEGENYGSQVSFFLVEYPRGRGPDLHRHPYEETFVVREGTGTFTVDGETIEAHAGEIVIVPAGAAHGFKGAGDDLLKVVCIHPSERVVQEDL